MAHLIFHDPAQLVLTSCILLVAQIVYVVFGFGSGLIAVGSLALVFPEIQDVVVLLLLVNLPAELAVVFGSWRHVAWRGAVGVAAGVALGIPVGTYVLKAASPTMILTTLGVFLIAVSLLFLALPATARVRWPSWSGPPVGLLSGLLTGLFGTGGPPLIVYYHLTGAGKTAFRGTLMALFLMMTFVRVPSYVLGGLVTAPRLWSGLVLLPVALVGAWLGQRIHLRIAEDTFRRLVSGLLGVIGLLLVVRQLGIL